MGRGQVPWGRPWVVADVGAVNMVGAMGAWEAGHMVGGVDGVTRGVSGLRLRDDVDGIVIVGGVGVVVSGV